MIINDKYNFIFQHNPKCGGTFLHHYFLRLNSSVGEEKLKEIFLENTKIDAHITFDKIADEKYKQYNLILGVREPVSLYVSLYLDMNYPKEIKNYYRIKNCSMKEKIKSNAFYQEHEIEKKANRKFDFENFMEKRTRGWSEETSVSAKFIDPCIDYKNVHFYKKENLQEDINNISEDLKIPYMETMLNNTRIRVSSILRKNIIHQSISSSLREKILNYESTIRGFYNE